MQKMKINFNNIYIMGLWDLLRDYTPWGYVDLLSTEGQSGFSGDGEPIFKPLAVYSDFFKNKIK